MSKDKYLRICLQQKEAAKCAVLKIGEYNVSLGYFPVLAGA